jgi:hypothetical protein
MTTSFRIIVKTISDNGEKEIYVTKDMTIEQLKKQIVDKVGKPHFADYWLSCNGKPVDIKVGGKAMTVGDYHLEDNSRVFVLARLNGGF